MEVMITQISLLLKPAKYPIRILIVVRIEDIEREEFVIRRAFDKKAVTDVVGTNGFQRSCQADILEVLEEVIVEVRPGGNVRWTGIGGGIAA